MRFGQLLGFEGVSGLLVLCHCKYALGGWIGSKLGTCFKKAIVIIYIILLHSYLCVLIYARMERNDLNTHDIQE